MGAKRIDQYEEDIDVVSTGKRLDVFSRPDRNRGKRGILRADLDGAVQEDSDAEDAEGNQDPLSRSV
jgi:hypothetical protein